MKYELAVFDLDGTLLNTIDDLMNSVNYALALNGYPLRSLEEIRQFVGNGMRTLIARSLPADVPPEKIDEVLSQFKAHYAVHKTDITAPYEGITELLEKLREHGMRLAVVSNKADASVQPLIRQFFPQAFDAVSGEREGVRRKPAPDSVNEVLSKTGVVREKAVYIGDSEIDVYTAFNAGMDLIAVTWGYREREILEKTGANVFAQTPGELADLICR